MDLICATIVLCHDGLAQFGLAQVSRVVGNRPNAGGCHQKYFQPINSFNHQLSNAIWSVRNN